MATNTQTYAGLTAENAEFYNRTLLERLTPELFFTQYGEKNLRMPKNNGAVASWRRYNSLAVSTTAITEGVTPDGVDLSISKINATVKQYGNHTRFTDVIQLEGLDSTLTEVTSLMGENAGESIDTIIRDIIYAGTSVQYAGNKTRATLTSSDKISELDILKIRRTLKRNKVKPIALPNGKKGYLAFIHTDVATDLMQLDAWKESHKYVDNTPDIEGLIGEWHGIYFLEADHAPVFTGQGASTTDVYGMLVIGKGFYGVPDIEGSSKPQIIIHKAGEAGASDPLDLINTVGWKAILTAVILNQLCGVRYECEATV